MGPTTRLQSVFQCHWHLGLWGYFELPVVLWCLVCSTIPSVHRVQGAFPIVVAVPLWDHQWVSWRVEFLCDNKSMVAALRSGTSQDQQLMVLFSHLSLLAVHHSFALTASLVPGKANPVAGALSRFQFQHFKCLAPHADPAPCQIPASLLAALQTT